MARAKLDLSQDQVAEAIGIAKKTLSNAENGTNKLSSDNAARLRLFYLSRGLEFTDYNGVRETPTGLRRYRGATEFREFYDDLYETAKTVGGDICLFNGVSANVLKWLGEDYRKVQVERMIKIKDRYTFRVIVEHGDNVFFGATYCEYRWFPHDLFNHKTFYVYGSKVAFVNFDNDDVNVIVIDDQDIATSQLLLFNLAWEHIAIEASQ